jgi:hypothetical protein
MVRLVKRNSLFKNKILLCQQAFYYSVCVCVCVCVYVCIKSTKYSFTLDTDPFQLHPGDKNIIKLFDHWHLKVYLHVRFQGAILH